MPRRQRQQRNPSTGRVLRRAVSRTPRALKGRGGYYDSKFVKFMNKYVPKGTFSSVGAAAGTALARGNPMGAQIGSMIGAGLSKIAGFGDYRVTSNSIMGEGNSPPAMHSNNSNMIIRHREYVSDVVSSSSANTFKNDVYPIQPGLLDSFPWLAVIAQNYQEYRIKGMVYEFKTLSSDMAISSGNSNQYLGGVVLATNYDVVAPNFANKQAAENTQYTTSAKPSCSFYHPIECAPLRGGQGILYTRAAAAPANSDLRLYDLGNLNVISFGIAGTSVTLGELWCTYEIEFLKAITADTDIGGGSQVDSFTLNNVTAANPFGSTNVPQPNNGIGGTLTNLVYSLPPDTPVNTAYIATWYCNGTAANVVYPTVSVNNCRYLDVFGGSVPYLFSPSFSGAVSSGTAMITFAFATNGQNPNISLSTGGTLPTSAAGYFIVSPMAANIE